MNINYCNLYRDVPLMHLYEYLAVQIHGDALH